ncbi:unnamed protein product [Closterium sp. Yama58-4]|nr:unnamed protein product [Closterium sp. Yama58-4]
MDDNEDDALSDEGEAELEADEVLIQDPATILNPDGTYRCPFCLGQMKQDYLFNEVKTHAEAQSKGTSKKGAKERRRHKMLVERLMRADMQPEKPVRAVNAAPLQTPAVVEDRILWPPVAIVKNLQTYWTYDKIQKRDILGGTTREELESTLKNYGPRKVDVLYNFKGHTGMALLLFEENAKGWEAASKLDKTYNQAGLGRKGYSNGRRRETKELFAWAAREQDLKEENEKGPLGSVLHKKHNATKSLREVLDDQESVKRQQEREERRVQERAFMRLSERLQDTEGRLKEMEDSTRALRRKHEQELAEAHAHTQEVVARQMRDRMREVQRMEGEMEWLQRQLKERSANEQQTRRRLEELTRQLKQQEQQGELQQQQAQRRAREMEELEGMFQQVRLKVEQKHQREIQLEEAKGKQAVAGEGEGSKEAEERVRWLEEELEEAKEMLDEEQERFFRLSVDARVKDDDVLHARKTVLEFLKEHQKLLKAVTLPGVPELVNKSPVRPQTVGLLKKPLWLKAYRACPTCKACTACRANKAIRACKQCRECGECKREMDDRDPNWQADFTVKFSAWEELIRSTDYDFFRVQEIDGIAKRVFNNSNEKVAKAMGEIETDFAWAGVADFKRAAAEIEEYNASGRYPVLLLVATEGDEAEEVLIAAAPKTEAVEGRKKRRAEESVEGVGVGGIAGGGGRGGRGAEGGAGGRGGTGGGGGVGGRVGDDSASRGRRNQNSTVEWRGVENGYGGGRGEGSTAGNGGGRGSGRAGRRGRG